MADRVVLQGANRQESSSSTGPREHTRQLRASVRPKIDRMTPLKRFRLGLLMLGVVAGLIVADTRPVSAQTRADEISRQQQAKAKDAKPDVPSRTERFFDQFEQGKWFVGQPKGWYPAFGSIYEGGGLAGGGGYRRYI